MTPSGPRLTIDEQNPWPGLGAFDEAAQLFFNGRREESAALRRLVMQAPLTVLFAASGLGKTSLVQAGLFPLLRKDSLPVYVRLDPRESEAPLIDQAKAALQTEIRNWRVDAPEFHRAESLWEYLHRTGLEFWSEENQLLTPLFVFDQFEEVFTLIASNTAAVARLRTDLADLIENRMPASLAAGVQENESAGAGLSLENQRYKVLLSFREDFLPAIEGWKRDIPSLMRNRLRLLPMSGEQAFEAVHKTAPDLAPEPIARRIVSFVAAAGEATAESAAELEVAPALLSLVCRGLNERRKEQKKTKFDEALLTGTGQAIVADFYRNAVAGLPEPVHRFIEEQLITERGFRKPCDVDDARTVHRIRDSDLALLVDRRVLRIEPARGTERVELTHDLLTGVVREDRGRRRERRQTERRMGAAVVALSILVVAGFAAYLSLQARNAKQAAAFFSALSDEDPLVRALVVAELGNSRAAADAVGSVQQVATSAIPLAVLGERETQQPGAPLIGAWFEPAGDKVDTISVSSNLEKWSSEGRGVPSLLSLPESESAAQNVDRAPHVSAVAVSANRGWIAIGFENGTLMITRSEGSERRRIPAASDATKITAVAFSPDANLILAGYAKGYIRVWNANGTIQRELGDEATRHTGSISSVQFSADGKWVLSSSWDGTAKIWDPKTGKPLAVLQREDAFAYTATFSPDGHLVICGYSDGPAWIWNSNGKGAPIKLEGHTGAVTSTSFSPDGLKVVTGSEDSSARIWALRVDDRAKVSSPTILSGHTLAVRTVAFSTDGKKIVTASDDGTAWVWWSDSQEPRILGTHADKVNSVAFSPDGKKVVSTSDDKTARVWNIDGSYQDLVYKSDSYVRRAAFDAGGTRVVAGSEDGVVYLWELGAKGKYLSAESDVLSVAFAPGGLAVITGTRNNLAQVWSLDYSKDQRPLLELKGHEDWVWRATFNREGSRIVTASQDATAMIWDVNRDTTSWAIKGLPQRLPHEMRVLDAAFSPDGSRVATASADRRARIWNLKHIAPVAKELQPVDKEFQHSDEVWSVEFSSDGKWLLTASVDKTAKIWGAEDGKPFFVFKHPSGVHTATFQPGSLDVVTGANDGVVRLWRTDLQNLVKYLSKATTACLTPWERVRFFAESAEEARSTYEVCETSHGRTPHKALVTKH